MEIKFVSNPRPNVYFEHFVYPCILRTFCKFIISNFRAPVHSNKHTTIYLQRSIE